MTDLELQAREAERSRRIAEFAFGVMLTGVQCNMGQAIPTDEDGRDAVRLARAIYAEIDQATAPAPPEKGEPPSQESAGDDWRDSLYVEDLDA